MEQNLSPLKPATKDANGASDVKRIIVMGASTGGFEAFKTIVKALPPDFEIPILIVWHMSPDVKGILPHVLNRQNKIYTADAYDREEIKSHRIYIAPPDHHLLIHDGTVRITRGPKENRFRPAIDPLFRSAAYTYGNRAIGVILSGALDDGTVGLWTIKHYGGITIVQDPNDAEVPSMPANANREVKADYCVPVSEIATLLSRLAKQGLSKNRDVMRDEQTKREIDIAAEGNALRTGVFDIRDLTPFTCPECNGVLARLQNGNITRYRCHTGHAFSSDTLLAAVTEKIENDLYDAIRGIEESVMLLNHMGDHFAEANEPKLAALYFKKAREAEERSKLVRNAAFKNEQLSRNYLEREMKNSTG